MKTLMVRDLACDAGSVGALQAFAPTHGLPVQPLDGPGGGQFVKLTDPDGFEPVPALPLPLRKPLNTRHDCAPRNAVKRIGAGPSAVVRLGHCVLNVSDFRRSEAWHNERFGFIASDEVQWPDGDPMNAAWGSRVAPMPELLGVQWGQNFADAHPGGPP